MPPAAPTTNITGFCAVVGSCIGLRWVRGPAERASRTCRPANESYDARTASRVSSPRVDGEKKESARERAAARTAGFPDVRFSVRHTE